MKSPSGVSSRSTDVLCVGCFLTNLPHNVCKCGFLSHQAATKEDLFMEVQIFGVRKSAETRKALRFFAERRIKTHFVDLNERAASLGELRRFAQKFGVQALIDRDGKRFSELGLTSALLSEERWLEKLSLEPLLLRVPLVRHQQQLTLGEAEETWRAWVAAARAAG